ncbi:ArsR family transcriptional regulator [Fictibacillus macauensis ZFHKF-1]|uniref:ArsR family transcriptional regulator n=1 Tax=Fictibacillus macauensis ZFHKF-1 TaxID=1196324 RepID=I8AM04_9BACL|nr:winged helix-turn-helix domain-containing protein [Fictibacillus macauensis]EIT86694.1 ArsR family transcriptional regulator [Fictibacillus macauensis ZFHKF-1]
MHYTLHIDDHPMYECLLSFLLYKRRANLKYLEKGTVWLAEVHAQLPLATQEKVQQVEDSAFPDALCLFIQHHNTKTIPAFLEWLQTVSVDHMYQLLAPHIQAKDAPLLLQLASLRNDYTELLTAWYDGYFQHQTALQQLISSGATLVKKAQATMCATKVVETFATGLQIEQHAIENVTLIPSVHFRPLHTFSTFKNQLFVWFPAPESKDPMTTTLQMTKVLSDPTRLKIIQLLAKRKRTFTEIVQEIGGTKGNVHHHIMTLRAAGLLAMHLTDEHAFQLSTRVSFIDYLHQALLEMVEK